jgi:hypothetical protein
MTEKKKKKTEAAERELGGRGTYASRELQAL